MAEAMEEQEQHIQDVYKAAKNLRELHEDVSYYEHALTKSRTVMPDSPFIPTFFLYIYFAFNTIYTIDWERSLEKGELIDSEERNENKKIKKLISFCFSDSYFVSAFYPTFMEILFMKIKKEDCIKALEEIVVDGVNVKKDEKYDDKKDAIDAFRKILTEDGFAFDEGHHVKTFCSFIYKVRCNIVHGTKLTEQMADPEQKNRILVYSYFLIAIQHMLFKYLKYKEEGYYSNKDEMFVENLRASHR